MAKSFQTSTTTDLTPSQFLMLTSLSMDDLKWQHRFVDNDSIEAERYLGNNTQKIKVSVNGEEVIVDSRYTSWALTDLGKNKRTASELLNAIAINKPAFTGEELDKKLSVLKAEAEAAAKDLEERFAKGELTASEKMVLGVGGHKLTIGLLIVNIAMFVVMVVSGVSIFAPESADLLKWGANFRMYTEGGDWWRLLSCTFIHIGIIHLALNMYALLSIGIYLEPLLGRSKLLAVYLATGIFASLTSIWWHGDTVSAGASGAIFGLYGLFLALLTTKFFDKDVQKPMLTSIIIFVGYNLVYGMKAGVDNAAHAGGLVGGLVLGYVYYFGIKNNLNRFFSFIAIGSAIVTAWIFLSEKKNDDAAFFRIAEQISTLEEKALAPLKDIQTLSADEFIRQSNEISLPSWKKADELLRPAMDFELTGSLEKRRAFLVEYIRLRIDFTKAAIQAERTGDWQETNNLSNRIDHIISEINKLQ